MLPPYILDLDGTIKEVSPDEQASLPNQSLPEDEQASLTNTVTEDNDLGWYDLHL